MALAKKPEGKPGAEAPTTAKIYTLSGILWTERGGVASINQRILREGETLDEYKVTRIEPGKVVLKKSDEEMVLNLFQSPVVITRHEDRFQVKRREIAVKTHVSGWAPTKHENDITPVVSERRVDRAFPQSAYNLPKLDRGLLRSLAMTEVFGFMHI